MQEFARSKRRFFVFLAVLIVVTFLGTAPTAFAAGKYNQFVGLGDSTIDSGYFRYNSSGVRTIDLAVAAAVARGASGGWVGPGIMASTYLAGRFGQNAMPIGSGGTNYGVGGSYTAMQSPGLVSTLQQIQNYLSSVGYAANPNALYLVSSGNNDLIWVGNQGSAWINANSGYLLTQAAALGSSVAILQGAGARNIMVPNSFYTAVLASVPGGFVPAANFDAYARAITYNNARWASLNASGVRYIPADLDSLFRYVIQHPFQFGFTPASVLSANAPSSVPALVSSLQDISLAQEQSYLFVDGHHLTTAGQRIEADYEASLLTAPPLMALLAEAPVQGGLARAATIQGQIDLSSRHRGPLGVNAWASAGLGSLNLKNTSGFSDVSGTPLSGSVGADYQFGCGLVLGTAFTTDTQTQQFSMGGGRFDRTDEAVSLYSAYQYGPVWANVVGSYGMYQDKTLRQVNLGQFADSNRGEVSGNSLALALRLGGDIPLGPVTTGPVAGLVLQRVRIGSFTETGTTGVTALSFGEQIRNSAISQLGWRAAVDLGNFRPFAEAKWFHELTDTNRKINTQLTTTTAGRSYSMDAPLTAKDWANVSLGTSYKVNEQLMLRLSGSADVFSQQMTSIGGEFGVNVAF